MRRFSFVGHGSSGYCLRKLRYMLTQTRNPIGCVSSAHRSALNKATAHRKGNWLFKLIRRYYTQRLLLLKAWFNLMQMCTHLYGTSPPPILNSHLIHCYVGYISVAYVDAVWSTQCELPRDDRLSVYQQTTAIRVGRHWLQRRKDRDEPFPHLKKQRRDCLQCMASAGVEAVFPERRLYCLRLFTLIKSVRNPPFKMQILGSSKDSSPLFFTGVTSDLSHMCII